MVNIWPKNKKHPHRPMKLATKEKTAETYCTTKISSTYWQTAPNSTSSNIKFNYDALKSPNSYSLRKFLNSLVFPYFFSLDSPPQTAAFGKWQETNGNGDNTRLTSRDGVISRAKTAPGGHFSRSNGDLIRPARLKIENYVENKSRNVPHSENSSGTWQNYIFNFKTGFYFTIKFYK